MRIKKLAEQRKLWEARVRPYLHFTTFGVRDALDAVRSQHFAGVRQRVEFHFVDRGWLACICFTDDSAHIYTHQVLNHRDTPIEVIRLICKHEFLHLVIPSITVRGREVQHPPEFWAREKEIAPEREAAWAWVWTNLGLWLKRRPRLEGIDVLPKWRESLSRPKVDVATCMARLPDPAWGEYGSKGW
jgi:hypothetical protein